MTTPLPAAPEAVRHHYDAEAAPLPRLIEAIDRALADVPRPWPAARLAPLDQFHLGGLEMTRRLADLARPEAGERVLDAGSGLGGPSRFLAETFGCEVRGVDLVPASVGLARHLAAASAAQSLLDYDVGSIDALPFPDVSFDLVWTQHVSMNLPDRTALYREFRRVLRPRGRLAFFDPALGAPGAELAYPVPWAADASASHLLTRDDTAHALRAAGFEVLSLEDVTADAMQAAARQAAAGAGPSPSGDASGPSPGLGLGLGLVVGPRMRGLVDNFRDNVARGRVCLLMGVAEAV